MIDSTSQRDSGASPDAHAPVRAAGVSDPRDRLTILVEPGRGTAVVCRIRSGAARPPDIVIDAATVSTRMRAEHSQRALGLGRRTGEAASRNLSAAARFVAREAVEYSLLRDVVLRLGFPALVAESIASQLAAGPGRDGGAVAAQVVSCRLGPGCWLSPTDLRAAIARCHGLTLHATDRFLLAVARLGRCTLPAAVGWVLGLVAGPVAAVAGLVASALRGEVSADRSLALSPETFAVHEGLETYTKHVWGYLSQPGARPEDREGTVILLGNGLAGTHAAVPAGARAKGTRFVRAWHPFDLPECLLRFLPLWGALAGAYHGTASYLHVPLAAGLYVTEGVRAFRALLHGSWLRKAGIGGGNRVVFGMVSTLDSQVAEHGFRLRGVSTVHWLHCMLTSPVHLLCRSTASVAMTELEREMRSLAQPASSCVTLPPHPGVPTRIAAPARSGTLLITNLVAPDATIVRPSGLGSLIELLELVASVCRRRGPLIWRPHPREARNRREFVHAESAARRLGFAIDVGGRIEAAVSAAGTLVATYSTTLGDMARLGRVPAIWAGLQYEEVGHWPRLPAQLKFRDARELEALLETLEEPVRERDLLEHLREQFCVDLPRIPPRGTFRDLSLTPVP